MYIILLEQQQANLDLLLRYSSINFSDSKFILIKSRNGESTRNVTTFVIETSTRP